MFSHAQQTDLALSDMQSRFTKLISIGTIKEVDLKVARVRVELGDWVTGWLPWLTAQASHDITWQAPELGEQVMVLAPCGDTAQGIVLGSIYSQAHPPAQTEVPEESRPDVQRVRYKDGSIIEYDRKSHKYLIDIKGADATVDVISAGTLNITTEKDITVTTKTSAKVFAEADVIINAKGNADVDAGGNVTVDASSIAMNGGTGCVTTSHICHFTGSPHGDGSSTVTAGK